MKETINSNTGSSQQEEKGCLEFGGRGQSVQSDRAVAKWMKSEWFDNWVKLAHEPHEETPH